MAENKKLSPYSIEEHLPIELEQYDCDERFVNKHLSDYFQDGRYGRAERLIMECLWKYQFVNRFNIERFTNNHMPPEKKRPSYANVIKRLYTDGVLVRFIYGDLILYALSSAGYKHMYENTHKQTTYEFPDDFKKIEEYYAKSKILEKASLAQWAISLESGYGKMIRKNIFFSYQKIYGKKEYITSLIEIKQGNLVFQFFSYPFPKSVNSYGYFINDIKLGASVSIRNNKTKTLTFIVICCPSLEDILTAHHMLAEDKELSFLSPLYTTDINTASFEGAKNLYLCEKTKEGTAHIKAVSLPVF